MTNKTCEHELNCTMENWLDENSVEVIMECNKCLTKFEGVLKIKYVGRSVNNVAFRNLNKN
jgi:hypothetical protein